MATAKEILSPLVKDFNHKQALKVIVQPVKDSLYFYIEIERNKRKGLGHSIPFDASKTETLKKWGEVMGEMDYLRRHPQAVVNLATKKAPTLVEKIEEAKKEAAKTGILDIAEEWRSTYKEPNSMGNARTLISSMKQFPLWAANPDIKSITKADCERFKQFLEKVPTSLKYDPTGKFDGRNLDPATIESRITRLKTLMNYAKKMEYILVSPAENLNYTAPEKDILFFTLQEIAVLAKTKSRLGSHDMKAAFLFGCHTGLRKVDIQAITFAQFGSLHGEKYEINPVNKIIQAKTNLSVHVVLNEDSTKIIRDQWNKLDVPAKDRIKLPIFSLQHSTRLGHAFKEWLEDAGIEQGGRTFRHARHSCGSNLNALDADLRDIQLILGHSNPRYTAKRYTGVDSTRLLDRVARLSTKAKALKRK